MIKVFFCAKGACFKLPRKRGGLKSASKNGPAQCLKTFFFLPVFFARSIKQFLRQKGVRPRFPGRSEAGSCLKNQFFSKEASRVLGLGGARKSSSCLTAAGLPRLVSRPAALPCSAGSAGLRAADGHGVHGPQLLHVAVLRVGAPRRVRRRSEGAHVLAGR